MTCRKIKRPPKSTGDVFQAKADGSAMKYAVKFSYVRTRRR